jgi:CopG family nickel-responsive transcriptional regulator
MGELVRFGVSMDNELVEALDRMVQRKNHSNRSEAIRDLVRRELINEIETDGSTEVVAIVQLIFQHGHQLNRNPIDAFPSLTIVTNLQQHLQRDICMKILIVAGRNDELRAWASPLINQLHVVGNLTIVAADSLLKELQS